MFVEYVTLNLSFPTIQNTKTLETVGQGLMVLLDGHFNNQLELEDFTLMEHAKLTMGDCASELCVNDEDFDIIFNNASNALTLALTLYHQEIKDFAQQLTSIGDIMMFEYPGMLRFCVKEGASPFAVSLLYV